MNRRRNSRGIAGIFLVAAVAVVLFLLLWLGFQYGLMLKASQQVRHSTDAAVLNIAKRASEVTVDAYPLYYDVADSHRKVGLSNINRVWGKALLINANLEEMRQEELHNDEAVVHADMAHRFARWTNDTLQMRLTDPKILNKNFKEISERRANSASNAAQLQPDSDEFYSATIGQGEASNLNFKKDQLPVPIERCQADGYLAGYQPYKLNDRQFSFVSFARDEMPHLVSDQIFLKNCVDLRSDMRHNRVSGRAVSNAFMATGVIESPNGNFRASASGVANPQRQFSLAIPYAYVTIQLRNRAKWYFENKFVHETAYDNQPEVQNGIPISRYKKFAKGGGYLDGYASLGNEYTQNGNFAKLLDFKDGTSKRVAMQRMLQRIREIKPDFSEQELQSLLAEQTGWNDSGKYYIYPIYQTPDCSDPKIVMTGNPDDLPKWLDCQSRPEGLDKIVHDDVKLIDEPNYCWGYRLLGGMGDDFDHWTEVSSRIYWKPGTGYSQCLGEMRIEHLTEIFFRSVATENTKHDAGDLDDYWLRTGRWIQRPHK